MTKELTNKKLIFDFNLDIAIKTKNLNLYYESFQALKNINIDINKNIKGGGVMRRFFKFLVFSIIIFN